MSEFYYIAIPLIAGFILDTLLGDPLWLPHPVRWFGSSISFLEEKFNTGENKLFKGLVITIFLVAIVFLGFYFVLKILHPHTYIYLTIAVISVFYGLANRNLITEALKVEKTLSKKGLEEGRKQLSYIVGRDTSQLSENKIRTAVLETLSENLSDGIIAPLFYYAIGGIPLMFAYKMINTLDSMTGYKNEKYKQFGFFAAKLDDVVNFLPARITALLMIIITLSFRGLKFIFLFGHKHSSPNAGYPEAALAGILNCRFGGPNIYHGKLLEKPYIGINDRQISAKDIYKACIINFACTMVSIGLIILGYWLSG